MRPWPTCSVIIPCYNHGASILRAIGSAALEAHEIIVVDDGSTDASAMHIDLAWGLYDKVKVIRHKQRQGVVAARNHAIELAQGDVILPLDADDWLRPNAIRKMLDAIEPKQFVYGNWIDVIGDAQIERRAPSAQLLPERNITHATYMYWRKDAEALGGYDTAFEAGGEDWAFMLALLSHGIMPVYLDIPLYHYTVNDTGRAAQMRGTSAQVKAALRAKYRGLYA